MCLLRESAAAVGVSGTVVDFLVCFLWPGHVIGKAFRSAFWGSWLFVFWLFVFWLFVFWLFVFCRFVFWLFVLPMRVSAGQAKVSQQHQWGVQAWQNLQHLLDKNLALPQASPLIRSPSSRAGRVRAGLRPISAGVAGGEVE